MFWRFVDRMWLLNLNEVMAKIGQVILPPTPLEELLRKESEIKMLPDSPIKHYRLSIVYKEMANGYAIKTQYTNFDYSSQVDSYTKLAGIHRSLGIQLAKETDDVVLSQ